MKVAIVIALLAHPLIADCTAPLVPVRRPTGDLDGAGQVRLDRSKPVPAKDEVLRAWHKRQDAVRSFRFAWTEVQCHPRGWMANPRYPERERLSIPALLRDRSYTVAKTLAVDGATMRYGFELDRAAEADGVEIKSPTGDNRGLGVRRHYSYLSVFDGQRGEARLSSLTGTPPPASIRSAWPADAQNLDTRAILLALRPFDPAMGHLLIDRAVVNGARTFHRGKSVHLLEERHDPSGWKTILWLEPERDFIVTRMALVFEQKFVVDMDIDYRHDARWGWVPSGWQISELLGDGTRRLISTATVTDYAVN